MQKRLEIARKISLQDYFLHLQSSSGGGSETDNYWLQRSTTIAQEILAAALRAEETSERIYKRQADRLALEQSREKDVKNKITGRRTFMQLFTTTSKRGLGITTTDATGRRDTSAQSELFRKSLISSYAIKHHTQDWLWCPILKDWVEKEASSAVHFFDSMHGQSVMTAIFGLSPMGATDELFAPENGLIIASAVASVFDKGFIAIVPRLPKDDDDDPFKITAAEEEISLWNNNNSSRPPKEEYILRALDFNSPLIDAIPRPTNGTGRSWRQLDGTPVEFLNEFRPRARYVYFHYCIQVMRLAWNQQHRQQQQQQGDGGGKNGISQTPPSQGVVSSADDFGWWWGGPPGKFLPRNMLLAFVEELGHEYEYEGLLKGAMDDDDDGPPVMDESSELMLAAAAYQVKSTAEKIMNPDDEDDSDDDSDDDE